MSLLTFLSESVPGQSTLCKLLIPLYDVYSVIYNSSSFSISPVNDINFGSVILNSKKSCSFVIENKGKFEFKYAISKLTQDKQRLVIRYIKESKLILTFNV